MRQIKAGSLGAFLGEAIEAVRQKGLQGLMALARSQLSLAPRRPAAAHADTLIIDVLHGIGMGPAMGAMQEKLSQGPSWLKSPELL